MHESETREFETGRSDLLDVLEPVNLKLLLSRILVNPDREGEYLVPICSWCYPIGKEPVKLPSGYSYTAAVCKTHQNRYIEEIRSRKALKSLTNSLSTT